MLRRLLSDSLRHGSLDDEYCPHAQATLVELSDAAQDFFVPSVSVPSLRYASCAAFEVDGYLVLASASDIICDQRLMELATAAAMSNVLEHFVRSVQLRLLIGDVTGGEAPILAQNPKAEHLKDFKIP